MSHIIRYWKRKMEFGIIHWDSTLLPALTGDSRIDRLTVLATTQGIKQLRGGPGISSSSGTEISSAVCDILCQRELTNKVPFIIFNMTLGSMLNGVCIDLEQKLEKEN